ncbi:hypothetical protein WOLCODRAFT_131970 [Wolfiporia cocos MD-104 SS10]|uniref:CCD97-like C-terminal domain-containing protein n=1 Tax=Wolfiporia cocos (strain MD-104) TaxID=742152 RepID=A0A2H3JH57_WOLCO|nr:hypothetical protein WOLCODRAFT_131970 [Wolfiporia cocos MD-104 SS10]
MSAVSRILSYLGLPNDYTPSPDAQPIEFLSRHLRQLPPHLLSHFSSTTTPKQRSVIPAIRNRRLRYADSNPPQLRLSAAKATWPTLWPGREPPGREQGEDERAWAEKFFMGSLKPHVGKLGMLLGGYEEERESERVRSIRRAQAEALESLPEEDESSDEDGEEQPLEEEESPEDVQSWFIRRIREQFIYGLLESTDYDKVDWDDTWDTDNDRDAEERWFDDEEESDVPPGLSE